MVKFTSAYAAEQCAKSLGSVWVVLVPTNALTRSRSPFLMARTLALPKPADRAKGARGMGAGGSAKRWHAASSLVGAG